METKTFKTLYWNHFTAIPNFFDFIDADVNEVFGKKGSFIVFNIVSLRKINEKYGRDFGDLHTKALIKAITSISSKYNKSYCFRFGSNDFVVILPNYTTKQINDISLEIKEQYKSNANSLGLNRAQLNKFMIEYKNDITSVEAFMVSYLTMPRYFESQKRVTGI
jgi:GGDEF domain-containing protein